MRKGWGTPALDLGVRGMKGNEGKSARPSVMATCAPGQEEKLLLLCHAAPRCRLRQACTVMAMVLGHRERERAPHREQIEAMQQHPVPATVQVGGSLQALPRRVVVLLPVGLLIAAYIGFVAYLIMGPSK